MITGNLPAATQQRHKRAPKHPGVGHYVLVTAACLVASVGLTYGGIQLFASQPKKAPTPAPVPNQDQKPAELAAPTAPAPIPEPQDQAQKPAQPAAPAIPAPDPDLSAEQTAALVAQQAAEQAALAAPALVPVSVDNPVAEAQPQAPAPVTAPATVAQQAADPAAPAKVPAHNPAVKVATVVSGSEDHSKVASPAPAELVANPGIFRRLGNRIVGLRRAFLSHEAAPAPVAAIPVVAVPEPVADLADQLAPVVIAPAQQPAPVPAQEIVAPDQQQELAAPANPAPVVEEVVAPSPAVLAHEVAAPEVPKFKAHRRGPTAAQAAAERAAEQAVAKQKKLARAQRELADWRKSDKRKT